MSIDLYQWDIPDGTEVLLTWLAPLVAPGCINTERPHDSPLPFIAVWRSRGEDDGFVDKGRYAVYVYGRDEADLAKLANDVKRRIQLLAPRFGGQQSVTISTGTVFADKVIVREAPHKVGGTGDTVPQSVYTNGALYEVWLRIAAAT